MPLVTPDYFNQYKIIALDPGLNNTGVSIFTMKNDFVKDAYDNLISIESFTLINHKLPYPNFMDDDTHDERFQKLHRMYQALNLVFAQYGPMEVVCEAPFFNRLRPTAFAPLVQVIEYIKLALFNYNPNINFKLIEPLLVKKRVGAGYVNGKFDMKVAVSNNQEIISKLITSWNLLDEHAIDSIAIGYGYLKAKENFYV